MGKQRRSQVLESVQRKPVEAVDARGFRIDLMELWSIERREGRREGPEVLGKGSLSGEGGGGREETGR